MKNIRGFTMIEILVVVAIIGVLAAVMLAGFNPVRSLERARDASRIADLKAIAKAQEIYYSENTEYASIGSNGGSSCADGGGLLTGIMDQVPVSTNGNIPYVCDQTAGATVAGFCLQVLLQATDGNCGGCDCSGATTCTMNTGNTHFCVTQQQ